jgi:hypothetical protein
MSPGSRARWFVVVIFAIAMAWVEAAVVFDLRTFVDRIQPYQPDPLPLIGKLGPVELVREFATLVMLGTAGWLAGWSGPTRLGFSALAFGIWDIFYYVFLKVMCDWPRSLLDWDILFLLPLPWWGPVMAPVLIAGLMIVWGTLITQFRPEEERPCWIWLSWLFNFLGSSIALLVFMQDSGRVADQGVAVIRQVLPTRFNWPLFLIALTLMSAPLLRRFSRFARRYDAGAKPQLLPQTEKRA